MNTNTHRWEERALRWTGAGLLFAALACACSSADSTELVEGIEPGHPAGSEPILQAGDDPVARFSATDETKAALDVQSWEVYLEGQDARIVGLDGDQQRAVVALLMAEPGDSVERVTVESTFPEHGALVLSRNAGVEVSDSDYLQRLGEALFIDLQQPSQQLAPTDKPTEGGDSEVGTARLALSTTTTGFIDLGWSPFGYNGNYPIYNGRCEGTRLSYDARSEHGASCWVNQWLNPYEPTDCGIEVHVGISGWRTDRCHWYVYAEHP